MVGKSMKRFFSLGVLSLFLVSMMAGIVSAEDLEDVGRTMGEGIREIFNALGGLFDGLLLGETLSVNETLSKVFMALLIGMFVYSALGTFFTDKNQKWVLNLATIAVTGLAIIGLPGNFLESVLLGYGAMGIALLMIVPFLVIFWFTVKTKNILLARGIWLFYTIYYFGLYFSALLTDSSQIWPKFIAMVLGGIMFFFILQVHRFIFHGEMENVKEKGMEKAEERKTRLAVEMERLKVDE